MKKLVFVLGGLFLLVWSTISGILRDYLIITWCNITLILVYYVHYFIMYQLGHNILFEKKKL